MSKHKRFQVASIRGYPLSSRNSKVSVADFSRSFQGESFQDFVDSLPRILAVQDLRFLAEQMFQARENNRALIWGFGGHVIKVGLAPVLIDLMKRGYATGFATNGSGLIHDFEIALAGSTSEDVEAELPSGRFGMAEETSVEINRAIKDGSRSGKGIGESVGELLDQRGCSYSEYSLVTQAYRQNVPLTVHVAFGTDIIHGHPEASGEAIGRGTQVDFQIFTQGVSELNDGGVFLNIGSAVVLPEVFLKAVSLVRNSGVQLENFTTANLDFIQHYRPVQNVLRRPVSQSGRGIGLTGHHEIMVPLLAAFLP
jgi:hypothetical protein